MAEIEGSGTERADAGDAVPLGGGVGAEVLRTRDGCIVRITAGGHTLAAVSGDASLARPIQADWLLASPAAPVSLRFHGVVSLSEDYPWQQGRTLCSVRRLTLRPKASLLDSLPHFRLK